MLEHIRIVLINTTHPGNIGATARAMKTMGLQHLYLVNPRLFPHQDATARATQATDILDHAKIFTSLDEAIHDCTLVLGASSRQRAIPVPTYNPRQAAEKIAENTRKSPIALLFGRESDGLSNEELDRCQSLITIPANPAYSALNLAAAVQVIAYELRMAALTLPQPASEIQTEQVVTHAELAHLWQHLEQSLIDIEFLNPQKPGYIMRHMQRLFMRAQLNARDINILHGILTAAQKKAGDSHRNML